MKIVTMNRHICNLCGKSYAFKNSLKRHLKSKHNSTIAYAGSTPYTRIPSRGERALNSATSSSSFSSSIPPNVINEPVAISEEGTNQGFDIAGAGHELPLSGDNISLMNEDPVAPVLTDLKHPIPEDFSKVYTKNWQALRTHYHTGNRYRQVYNWRLTDPQLKLKQQLWALFRTLTHASKLNASYGFILIDINTQLHRYYHSSFNEGRVLEKPQLVANEADMKKFVEKVYNLDVLSHITMQRPDTKSVVVTVTNFSLSVDRLSFPLVGIGNGVIELPQHVKDNRYILSLTHTPNYCTAYNDKLCLFRCLCRHFHGKVIEFRVQELYSCYLERFELLRSEFDGVKLNELGDVENLFQVNINVYSLDRTDGEDSVTVVQRSFKKFECSMHLHLYKCHFSYILDIKKLAKIYKCDRCEKILPLPSKLFTHQLTCSNSTARVFPRGAFSPSKTIFEKLENEGIVIPNELRFYPFHAVYDIEVFFDNSELPSNTETMNWEVKHVLGSISLASNIPGFVKPVCFLSEGNSQELVDQMMRQLLDMQEKASEILFDRYSKYLSDISKLDYEMQKREKLASIEIEALKKGNKSCSDDSESGESECDDDVIVLSLPTNESVDFENIEARFSSDEDSDEQIDKLNKGVDFTLKDDSVLLKLKQELCDWLSQLIVFGFKSSSYDLCILKEFVVRYFHKVEQEITQCVKKGNKYMSLSTKTLKFLDCGAYLAPNTTLDAYMKAWGCPQRKEFFCYEWFTSLDKLNETQLPPQSAFYSKLKDQHISDEDYAHCLKVWREANCKTMADYLILYNNADVEGFCICVDRQKQFYSTLGVDLAKVAISLPGVSQRVLFSTLPSGVSFPYFSKKHTYLYDLFRGNIRGGQSIVVNRYGCVGESRIREFAFKAVGQLGKPLKRIVGYDCSAMYLWCLSQCELPTGSYILRRSENDFKRERAYTHGNAAVEWMSWMERVLGVKIQHLFSQGEKSVGELRVRPDGYVPPRKGRSAIALFYNGCRFHTHLCSLAKQPIDRDEYEESENDREKLAWQRAYLETLGIRVFSIYECEWLKEIEGSADIQNHLKKLRGEMIDTYKLSEQRIISLIASGKLYGAVEVDIEVPENLKSYFGDFQPIFKHSELSRDSVGEFMKDWCEKNDYLTTPRHTLINSYFGQKHLVLTPLLRWYLQHGLKITKVHTVIQYKPVQCFKQFGDFVMNSRREGDIHPDKQILAQSAKLTGNSSYGKFLENTEKHRKILFMTDKQGDNSISNKLNTKYFRNIDHLGEDLYELSMFKKGVMLNQSVQIGFAILEMAKLKLLSFIYDCLDKFVHRHDYQICYSDTDSIYIMLAADNIYQLIKPELKSQFIQEYNDWFPKAYCPAHKDLYFNSRFTGIEFDPCPECKRIAKWDSRTAGLFHLEAEGTQFVGLNSKCYMVHDDNSVKYSSKGLSKRNKLNIDNFLSVLRDGKSVSGVNRGFRFNRNTMYTYEQQKVGLSYFYGKRIVCVDGATTLPTEL